MKAKKSQKFKTWISDLIGYANSVVYGLVIAAYRAKNINKRSALIFTDSRGFEITKKLNKKNPFSSAYANWVIKNYKCEVVLCPEKHTTIIDFVWYMRDKLGSFDLVVLHCGVVDFSRRPKSQLKSIFELKKSKFSYVGFPKDFIVKHMSYRGGSTYYGEETASLYTQSDFQEYIIPKLKQIPSLVIIGCNPVLPNWRGSYWQDRPSDMNVILDYCNIIDRSGIPFLDLSEWGEEEVKSYTSDNVHPSSAGFEYLKTRLIQIVEQRGGDR